MIFFIHNDQREERVKNLKEQTEFTKIETFGIQKAIFTSSPKAGISQAHRSVVAKAKEQGWSYVVIMEDDIKFTDKDSFMLFMNMITLCPDEVDILLGGLYTTSQLDNYKGMPFFKQVDNVSGFHCYCVFQKAYDRFLEAPDNYHIDKWTTGSKLGNLLTLTCYPFLAIQQDDFYSDNKKQIKNYSHLLKKYELFESKKLSIVK